METSFRRTATSAALWVLAFVLMIAAGRYQRTTGPTYPLGGGAVLAGRAFEYEFIRSETTDRDARVAVPLADPAMTATLRYVRFGTEDTWSIIPMTASGDSLVAALPRQPAAGKLAYVVEATLAGESVTLPGRDPVVIRFKGAVPIPILLAHVAAMFLAMMIAVRAALEVIVRPCCGRTLALVALGLMTLGGLILGPVVQKFAFGEFWTGIPFGYDLTDNKTLLMWLAWGLAVAAWFSANERLRRARRAIVVCAAAVMLAVYLIPHSLGGSQLDYEQVDRGVDPLEAIGTGRP